MQDILFSKYEKDKDYIGFSPEKTDIILQLRDFNYERIYNNAQMRQRKETIDKRIADLFDYFRGIFDKYGFDYAAYGREGKQTAVNFAKYMQSMEKAYRQDPAQRDMIITDYIAGMTDSYALNVMEDVILPNSIKFFSWDLQGTVVASANHFAIIFSFHIILAQYLSITTLQFKIINRIFRIAI